MKKFKYILFARNTNKEINIYFSHWCVKMSKNYKSLFCSHHLYLVSSSFPLTSQIFNIALFKVCIYFLSNVNYQQQKVGMKSPYYLEDNVNHYLFCCFFFPFSSLVCLSVWFTVTLLSVEIFHCINLCIPPQICFTFIFLMQHIDVIS